MGPGGVKREYRHYAQPEALMKRTGHVAQLRALDPHGDGYSRPADLAVALGRVLDGGGASTGFLVVGVSEYHFGDSEVVMVAYAVMASALAATRPEAGAECGAGKWALDRGITVR